MAALQPGERLKALSGTVTVDRVVTGSEQSVFNLEVHRAHTFFVGDAGLWVHNECKVQYDPRIARRMQEDPGPMHNFPFLVDREVIEGGTKTVTGSYSLYVVEGTWKFGGKVYEGMIEIGGKLADGVFTITHRLFRPFK